MVISARKMLFAFGALAGAAFLVACAGSKRQPEGIGTTVVLDSSDAIVLGCADAAIDVKVPGPRGLRVGGIAFDSAAVGGGGLRVSHAGRNYVFFKNAIYDTRKKGHRTTATVLSPPLARLYYAGSAMWSAGPSNDEIVTGARRKVTVASCRDNLVDRVAYLGGFLVTSRSCLTLQVADANGRASRTVKIALGIRRC